MNVPNVKMGRPDAFTAVDSGEIFAGEQGVCRYYIARTEPTYAIGIDFRSIMLKSEMREPSTSFSVLVNHENKLASIRRAIENSEGVQPYKDELEAFIREFALKLELRGVLDIYFVTNDYVHLVVRYDTFELWAEKRAHDEA